MKRWRLFMLLLCFGACMMVGCGEESYLAQASVETDEEAIEEESTTTVTEQMIYVHVEGAVANPGVYELTEGSRVYEAIELAGGLLEDAYSKDLNQARELSDGEKIYVATVGEETADDETDDRVNINTADVDELTSLSGIGESRAQDIIDYRESNGAFSSTEELMNVSGIGEATYAKLQDQIKVE